MTETPGIKKAELYRSRISRVERNALHRDITDTLAVEEPLEIRLGLVENGKFVHKAVSITMRTPGNDFELAAGFLFTEAILHDRDQIKAIRHCGKFPNSQNTVRLDLSENAEVNLEKLARNFYTTSSCGVCGKSSLEALTVSGAEKVDENISLKVSAGIIHELPEKLLENQTVFGATGGLHAAALFDVSGNLIALREDVGRHNAVDKLIGAKFLENALPLDENILFLSGRASFELVQKAVMAKIPVICAVGAPSSLAVEAAKDFNITLLGFVRDERFNIYSGEERLKTQSAKREVQN